MGWEDDKERGRNEWNPVTGNTWSAPNDVSNPSAYRIGAQQAKDTYNVWANLGTGPASGTSNAGTTSAGDDGAAAAGGLSFSDDVRFLLFGLGLCVIAYFLQIQDHPIYWISIPMFVVGGFIAFQGALSVLVHILIYAIPVVLVGGAILAIVYLADKSPSTKPSESALATQSPLSPVRPVVNSSARKATVSGVENLWLRSGPGTNFSTITMMPNGAKVSIIHTAENGWQEINYLNNDGQVLHGFANGKNLVPDQQ